MSQSNNNSIEIIEQNFNDDDNKKNTVKVDTMEGFIDIFDILNDHNEQGGGGDEEEILENMMEEYNRDFDFNYIHTNVDGEEMIIEYNSRLKSDHGNKIVQEQILSQNLSQLFTKDEYTSDEEYVTTNTKRQLSTPSTPNIASKRIRLGNDDEDPNDDDTENQKKNEIPPYLRSENKIFDQLLTNQMVHNSITTEDVRQLAVLKHKIAVFNILKELWTIFLKSGTGQPWKKQGKCKKTNVDQRFWPIQVKKRMPPMDDPNQERDEQILCETIVYQYLESVNKTIEQDQTELNQKKNDLIDYTDELDNTIEKFVQQHGIQPLQLKFNYKIAVLEYNYDLEILQREYLHLNPTESQIQQARRLCDTRFKYSESKQKLIELKQRILCNKPTKSMYPIELLASIMSPSLSTDDSIIDKNVYQQQQRRKDQHEKEIQEKLTDSMIVSIIEHEDTISEHQHSFDKEMNVTNDQEEEDKLTGKLVDIIYQRFKIIERKLQYIYNFRINQFLQSGDSVDVDFKDRRYQSAVISFSPTMIIDTTLHQLTSEQLKLLNRGPTYVPPCQMYVSSSSNVSMDEMIQKQYKLLQHNLNLLFAKFQINTARSMFINKEIKDLFTNMFSISSLPSALHQRALYEQELVESIREHLKTNNLILRRLANQRNIFYLGNMEDFQEKANDYMLQTNTFEFCEIIDETNLHRTHEYLNSKIKSNNSELETIFHNKKIFNDVLKKLYIHVNKIQLPYLYFLPDMSSKKHDLSLEPIIVAQNSVTSQLAQFLDKLLRPVLTRLTQSTIFRNEADFIQKLNQYAIDKKHLHPETIFATIKILNFDRMVPHGTMLITLQDFLTQHLPYPSIENVSINKIIRLTALFLHNNRFYYDNKIYRFARGSPTNFLLTETLSNIFLFQWQRRLIQDPLLRDELYGRCKNQIFFTWNSTTNELQQVFQKIRSQYPEVQFEEQMDFKIKFLNDVNVENLNGTFYSSVYHDPTIPKYTLPYVIDNTKVAHSHWLRSSLIRAVRYCTSVFDFNQERVYLEITCLANGYPIEFIQQRIIHFFNHFDAISLRSSLDQHVYDKLRHRLFNFISEQHQFIAKNQQLEKNNQQIRLSYHYQFGPKDKFNKKLRDILLKHLSIPSTAYAVKHNKIKIILTTKQQYSLNALLSQQKPYHPILNKEKPLV